MFPTEKEFMEMEPGQAFLFLTGYIAREIASGTGAHRVNAILSCLDPDARQALCVGVACARALGVDPGYRDALKHAMATVFYQTMNDKGGMQHA